MDSSLGFDVKGAVDLVTKYSFTRIVLQFTDEFLPIVMEIFDYFKSGLPKNVEVYITADSTYGSSVDDVSSLHVSADLLIYFGTEVSVSGSIPVLVLPQMKPIDLTLSAVKIIETIKSLHRDKNYMSILMIADPSYYHTMEDFEQMLRESTDIPIISGEVPRSTNMKLWQPSNLRNIGPLKESVGGMLVDVSNLDDTQTLILFLGDKKDLLATLFLRLSQQDILWYQPSLPDCSVSVFRGHESKEFQERYGGVSKAKDANTIGIIVGSMGLTGEVIQDTVRRLQALVVAAKKKSYLFVMGRINEAKLGNFPEIDVFCLIANEETALIKPKSFPVPVITPFELELALGAHDWTSSYITNAETLANHRSAAADTSDKGSITEELVERVRAHWREEDDDEGGDEGARHSFAGTITGSIQVTSTQVEPSCGSCGCESVSSTGFPSSPPFPSASETTALVAAHPGLGSLITSDLAAVDYFQNRNFRGLTPALTAEDWQTGIRQGITGISTSYRNIEALAVDNRDEKLQIEKVDAKEGFS